MKLISKSKILDLTTPQVMGILNVTPDSFSDAGKYNRLDDALVHAQNMLAAGASILDIGGESTRPGAKKISDDEELSRVIPVIETLRLKFDCWISVDTSKAIVMQEAISAGADLINDVRALQEDGALDVAVKANVPVCLMHMQGLPLSMQSNPSYEDLFIQMHDFFNERIDACEKKGLDKSKLILDPGFGFGKNSDHNYQLLENVDDFHRYGLPILVGMSRKSMIYQLLGRNPDDVLAGSLACATIAAMKGVQIIRVHDVKETVDIVKVFNMINIIEKKRGERQR